ncbi:hypothetical protein AAHE18_03G181700 [Arachis hypogaea]
MSALSLRGILENNKLARVNYDDCYRNLRIVLMHERLIDIIDKPAVTAPVPKEDGSIDIEATKAYEKFLKNYLSTKSIILASMCSDLQRQHQDMDPPTITTRYQLSKTLFRSTLDVDSPVRPHVLKMIDLIDQLEKLGCELGKELSQDLILQSLWQCFNMIKVSCDLYEMLNMLIDYENQIASEKKKGVAMVVGSSSKKKGKRKAKENGKNSFKREPMEPKGGVTKSKGKQEKADKNDAECFYCKCKGH